MNTGLIDAVTYARWTGDTASAGADVGNAINDAVNALNDHCHRAFAYGKYQETLYIYPDGKVYPAATPLEAVVDPAGDFTVQGAGVWIGWWDPYPILANPGSPVGGYPPQTTITYTGGYQSYGSNDGPTPPLPVTVARAVAQLAYRSLHPIQLPNVPANANSVHVGDVGYSGTKPLSVGVLLEDDDPVATSIAGYVRRQVRGWQTAPKPVA